MVRITLIDSDEPSKKFKVEGRLTGEAVGELRQLCEGMLDCPEHGRLILDLADVSFIDNEGIELVRDLRHDNVLITQYSPFLAQLLKEALPC